MAEYHDDKADPTTVCITEMPIDVQSLEPTKLLVNGRINPGTMQLAPRTFHVGSEYRRYKYKYIKLEYIPDPRHVAETNEQAAQVLLQVYGTSQNEVWNKKITVSTKTYGRVWHEFPTQKWKRVHIEEGDEADPLTVGATEDDAGMAHAQLQQAHPGRRYGCVVMTFLVSLKDRVMRKTRRSSTSGGRRRQQIEFTGEVDGVEMAARAGNGSRHRAEYATGLQMPATRRHSLQDVPERVITDAEYYAILSRPEVGDNGPQYAYSDEDEV